MGDEVADEGDWYAALVAGEHVGDWLDTVRNAKIPPGRRTRAASQLAEKVAADPTYADEARESDAADVCDAAARARSGRAEPIWAQFTAAIRRWRAGNHVSFALIRQRITKTSPRTARRSPDERSST